MLLNWLNFEKKKFTYSPWVFVLKLWSVKKEPQSGKKNPFRPWASLQYIKIKIVSELNFEYIIRKILQRAIECTN